MDRGFMTAAEVAHELGVTTGRVYQLIHAGIIPAIRLGKAVRIPRAAWDAWTRQQLEIATSRIDSQ